MSEKSANAERDISLPNETTARKSDHITPTQKSQSELFDSFSRNMSRFVRVVKHSELYCVTTRTE